MNDNPENKSPIKENLITTAKAGGLLLIAGILVFLYILGVMIWYFANP